MQILTIEEDSLSPMIDYPFQERGSLAGFVRRFHTDSDASRSSTAINSDVYSTAIVHGGP